MSQSEATTRIITTGLHRNLHINTVPPTRASRRSPVSEVPLGEASAILQLVDDLGSDVTGALVFGEAASAAGAVLVERGRVCWSIAQGLTRRLTDILCNQAEPPLEHAAVERVVADCKASQKPIGEALVSAGLVDPEGLRSGLKLQSAEAIALLAMSGKRSSFLPHRKQTYSPQYSFSTAELLATLGSLKRPEESLEPRKRLRSFVHGYGAGAVFSRSGASPVLLGIEEMEHPLTVTTINDMVSWATGQLDVAGAVAPGLKVVASSNREGPASVAWQEEQTMYLALCESQTALARVLMAVSRR